MVATSTPCEPPEPRRRSVESHGRHRGRQRRHRSREGSPSRVSAPGLRRTPRSPDGSLAPRACSARSPRWQPARPARRAACPRSARGADHADTGQTGRQSRRMPDRRYPSCHRLRPESRRATRGSRPSLWYVIPQSPPQFPRASGGNPTDAGAPGAASPAQLRMALWRCLAPVHEESKAPGTKPSDAVRLGASHGRWYV